MTRTLVILGLFALIGFSDSPTAAQQPKKEARVRLVSPEVHADKKVTFRIRAPLGQDGVPAGAYRVLVRTPEGRRDSPIDAKYTRYTTSGLEVTVNEAPTMITLTVKRKKR